MKNISNLFSSFFANANSILFTTLNIGWVRNRFPLTMDVITYFLDEDTRCLEIHLFNNLLLENRNVAEGIYNSIWSLPEFRNLGNTKVILTTGKEQLEQGPIHYNIHPNVFVTNNTTLQEYKSKTDGYIRNRYDASGYVSEITPYFIVKIWNMDTTRNYHIKINKVRYGNTVSKSQPGKRLYSTNIHSNKNQISKWSLYKDWLKEIRKNNPHSDNFITHYNKDYNHTSDNRFAVLDLETVKLEQYHDFQVPVCITHCQSVNNEKYYQINTVNLSNTDYKIIINDVNAMFKSLSIHGAPMLRQPCICIINSIRQ